VKRIIYIGGTARSGSTLLDMVLSNDPKGMSLGEVVALFRPFRKHHYELRRKLMADTKWKKILKEGEDNLYPNLFHLYPKTEFFVDSSKNPFWIKKQSNIIQKEGANTHQILIYKTPVEFANSLYKRGQGKNWKKSWIQYHRKYFTLIQDFKTISYGDFIKNPEVLERLCNWFGLEFSTAKYRYWEHKSLTFFGSNTTKIKGIEKKEGPSINQKNHVLEYDNPSYPNIRALVDKEMADNNEIPKILEVLQAYSSFYEQQPVQHLPSLSHLTFSRMAINLMRMKNMLKNLYRRHFPEDYFKGNSD
jgi:hypothetical protein